MNRIFEALYKEHYQKLYTLAFRMTGNKEDAEDILQTSFYNAYKAFDTFRHESSAYTWLYRIVLNASKNFYKENRKLPVEIYSEEHNISQEEIYNHINQFGQVENQALANLTRETCLQMFMNCMPSKYRAVYTLRVVFYFSVKETAEILEISENTVKVNFHRAKSIINDHMDGRCSLIKSGSMCDCRFYAKYLVEKKKTDQLINIETVRNKERIAANTFKEELCEVLEFDEIDDLYNNQIKAPDYKGFLATVKNIRKNKNLKILEY